MSQVTYKDISEKLTTKKVWYEGSDTLVGGSLLCYNGDYGTASSADTARAWRVEKPATANLKYFAGVLAEKYDNFTGPGMVEIYVSTRRGQRINILSDQNCTLGSTILAVKNADYAAGAAADGYNIARAAQTVDRSGTDGQVQVELYGFDPIELEIQSDLDTVESKLLLVESEAASNDSEILFIESEISQVQSKVLLLESETASLQSLVGIVAKAAVSSLDFRVAKLQIRGATYQVVSMVSITG